MRFKSPNYYEKRVGETRIRKKFLFCPRCFQEDHYRWLEFADIVEEMNRFVSFPGTRRQHFRYDWVETGFADVENRIKEAKDGDSQC